MSCVVRGVRFCGPVVLGTYKPWVNTGVCLDPTGDRFVPGNPSEQANAAWGQGLCLLCSPTPPGGSSAPVWGVGERWEGGCVPTMRLRRARPLLSQAPGHDAMSVPLWRLPRCPRGLPWLPEKGLPLARSGGLIWREAGASLCAQSSAGAVTSCSRVRLGSRWRAAL